MDLIQVSTPLSLYLHLPWCVSKCPYCDFNSHKAGENAPFDRYTNALNVDIENEARRASDRAIASIFIGGGTPSLFTPAQIKSVLDQCRAHFSIISNCEITMEVNPGRVEYGNFSGYLEAGVNRLSIGAQSFDNVMLQALGRIHGPEEIRAAFSGAVKAGFDNINIDLMFALPGQQVDQAAADISYAVELSPQHISYYQLTLEQNTVFYKCPPKGIPNDDITWEMQNKGHRLLKRAGYQQYEISAFAQRDRRCFHNVNYWQFGDYLAAGAGAHGKITTKDGKIIRYRKASNPQEFIEHIETGCFVDNSSYVAGKDLVFEFMLNALRMLDGFSIGMFHERTGLDSLLIETKLHIATEDGLLERVDEDRWRPTYNGLRFLNDLQARFLP